MTQQAFIVFVCILGCAFITALAAILERLWGM